MQISPCLKIFANASKEFAMFFSIQDAFCIACMDQENDQKSSTKIVK